MKTLREAPQTGIIELNGIDFGLTAKQFSEEDGVFIHVVTLWNGKNLRFQNFRYLSAKKTLEWADRKKALLSYFEVVRSDFQARGRLFRKMKNLLGYQKDMNVIHWVNKAERQVAL